MQKVEGHQGGRGKHGFLGKNKNGRDRKQAEEQRWCPVVQVLLRLLPLSRGAVDRPKVLEIRVEWVSESRKGKDSHEDAFFFLLNNSVENVLARFC